MNYILTLLLFFLIYSQEKVNIGSNPLKDNALSLNETKKLIDEEGYYDRVFAKYNHKGQLVVADAGNKRILIYDDKFELLKEFGKEGNGPEEIDNIFMLELIEDRIIIQGMRTLKIFDYNGKFIASINRMEYGFGEFYVIDNQMLRVFRSSEQSKYKRIYYDKNGNESKKIKNENYVQKDEQSRMRVMFIGGSSAVKHGNFIAKNSGKKAYSINLLDENFELKKVLYRDFTPVKRDFSRFQFNFNVTGVSKKQAAKMKADAESRMRKQMGEYEEDVQSIIGEHNQHLIVRTACENMTQNLQLDIIKDNKLYTTLNHKFEDEIQSVVLSKGHLIVSLNNEEDGPHIRIFDLQLN